MGIAVAVPGGASASAAILVSGVVVMGDVLEGCGEGGAGALERDQQAVQIEGVAQAAQLPGADEALLHRAVDELRAQLPAGDAVTLTGERPVMWLVRHRIAGDGECRIAVLEGGREGLQALRLAGQQHVANRIGDGRVQHRRGGALRFISAADLLNLPFSAASDAAMRRSGTKMRMRGPMAREMIIRRCDPEIAAQPQIGRVAALPERGQGQAPAGEGHGDRQHVEVIAGAVAVAECQPRDLPLGQAEAREHRLQRPPPLPARQRHACGQRDGDQDQVLPDVRGFVQRAHERHRGPQPQPRDRAADEIGLHRRIVRTRKRAR